MKLEELTIDALRNTIWPVNKEQSKILCNKAKDFGFNYWSGEIDIKSDANIIFKDNLYFQHRQSMPNYYTERKFDDYFINGLTKQEIIRIHDTIEYMEGRRDTYED